MSVADEIYYQTHELTLRESYEDYLTENSMTSDECSFFDFLNEL